MHITTHEVKALAQRRIAALLDRAAQYKDQAAARPGDPRNMTLATMVDRLADEGASATGAWCDVLDLAAACDESRELGAAWRSAASTLNGLALECRMASWHVWALGPSHREQEAA